jgi:precorrin-2 methylase
MRKHFKFALLAGVSSLALCCVSGCAALNSARTKAVATLCANRDTLIAVALANGDNATVKAIDAYCPVPAPVS